MLGLYVRAKLRARVGVGRGRDSSGVEWSRVESSRVESSRVGRGRVDLLVGGGIERRDEQLVVIEKVLEDGGGEDEAPRHVELHVWNDALHVELVEEVVEEAEATPLTPEGACTIPHDRCGLVGRVGILDRRRQLVAVVTHFSQDPIAQPVGSLLASVVNEVGRIHRVTKALGEREFRTSKEPAREMSVAGVVCDRVERQIRPHLHHLGDVGHLTELMALGVGKLQGAEHEVVEHEVAQPLEESLV